MKKPEHERTCLECGAAFVPRHHSQTICSDECRRARDNRHCAESRVRCTEKKLKAAANARKEKASRRAAFFAARDAAWEAAGTPKTVVSRGRNGRYIISRGSCSGSHACKFFS